MKRRIAGILFVLIILAVASSLVFADTTGNKTQGREVVPTEVNFTAQLCFDSDMDEQATLELTNHGTEEMVVSSQAHYIDQIGSAGSWDCRVDEDVSIGPQETKRIPFVMEEAVTHGDDSILAFFFQYEGKWYLGKVGINNGTEYFLEHV